MSLLDFGTEVGGKQAMEVTAVAHLGDHRGWVERPQFPAALAGAAVAA